MPINTLHTYRFVAERYKIHSLWPRRSRGFTLRNLKRENTIPINVQLKFALSRAFSKISQTDLFVDWVHKLDSLWTVDHVTRVFFLRLMNLKSVIDLQMILQILYWGARLNFMFSLPQLHTKSLCVLTLQNSQFEASTSSRPQTVNFEALGHKAIQFEASISSWPQTVNFVALGHKAIFINSHETFNCWVQT